jgi:hypothetical protein
MAAMSLCGSIFSTTTITSEKLKLRKQRRIRERNKQKEISGELRKLTYVIASREDVV